MPQTTDARDGGGLAVAERLVDRLEALLERVDRWIPQPPPPIDWTAMAFRWRTDSRTGWLEAIDHPRLIRLDDLRNVDEQKRLVEQNTRQFLRGAPANNVLLTGARGTGKSSLVKAMLEKYQDFGLRLIEVDKEHLVDLPLITRWVRERDERFILFCDDLSFESGEPGYKALKVALDGSVAAESSNLLIYATSNRRHLLPEYHAENLEAKLVGEEIHPGESVEEKIALSERFGLWVSFYPFSQQDYLTAVERWLEVLAPGGSPIEPAEARIDALQWALQRGSRSGRVAYQFARDYVGRCVVARMERQP